MNFFGHVVVSSWRSSDPAVALGSMLPDLANMCRGRVVQALDPRVAEGVALHHATDAAFHTLEDFSRLERQTTRDLQALGVSRGPAMGTAHVAVELLLDGALLADQTAGALYLAALACEQAHAPETSMAWREPEEIVRWRALHARLQAYGLPHGYRDPEVVADRVATILRGYKTLALDTREVQLVRGYLDDLQERVLGATPGLMRGLRQAMTGHGQAEPSAEEGNGPHHHG